MQAQQLQPAAAAKAYDVLSHHMIKACQTFLRKYWEVPNESAVNIDHESTIIPTQRLNNHQLETQCIPRTYQLNEIGDRTIVVSPSCQPWVLLVGMACGRWNLCMVDWADFLEWRRVLKPTGTAIVKNEDSDDPSADIVSEEMEWVYEAPHTDSWTIASLLEWSYETWQQNHMSQFTRLDFCVAIERTILMLRQYYLPVCTIVSPLFCTHSRGATEHINTGGGDNVWIVPRTSGRTELFTLYSGQHAVSAQLYDMLVLTPSICRWNITVAADVMACTELQAALQGGSMAGYVQNFQRNDLSEDESSVAEGLVQLMSYWYIQSWTQVWDNLLFNAGKHMQLSLSNNIVSVNYGNDIKGDEDNEEEPGYILPCEFNSVYDHARHELNTWMTNNVHRRVTTLLHQYTQAASTQALCSMPVIDPIPAFNAVSIPPSNNMSTHIE